MALGPEPLNNPVVDPKLCHVCGLEACENKVHQVVHWYRLKFPGCSFSISGGSPQDYKSLIRDKKFGVSVNQSSGPLELVVCIDAFDLKKYLEEG